VPTEEEIDRAFHLIRVMWKAVLGLHYKRKEQKKRRAARDLLATTYAHWLRPHFNN
jgi:hypothetical protein